MCDPTPPELGMMRAVTDDGERQQKRDFLCGTEWHSYPVCESKMQPSTSRFWVASEEI